MSPFKTWPFQSTKCFAKLGVWQFVLVTTHPAVGQDLLIHEVSKLHPSTHHSQYDSYGRVITPSQRLLSDITQHSQQTDNPAPGGIRTHNLSRRAAEDLRHRPCGHLNRHLTGLGPQSSLSMCSQLTSPHNCSYSWVWEFPELKSAFPSQKTGKVIQVQVFRNTD